MFEEYIITFCLLVLVFSRHTFKLALTRDFKEKKGQKLAVHLYSHFRRNLFAPTIFLGIPVFLKRLASPQQSSSLLTIVVSSQPPPLLGLYNFLMFLLRKFGFPQACLATICNQAPPLKKTGIF